LLADASFGASPVVASALGATPDATPARRIEHTTGVSNSRPNPELSTLPGTGSFYFALTGARPAHPSRGLMNLPDRIQQTILAAMGMKATNSSL
jgi:hypothetical protein